METLVHTRRINLCERNYDIFVYCRTDGSYVAKTFFAPADVIINDGSTMEDALTKHERLLPLAIDSRHLLMEYKKSL